MTDIEATNIDGSKQLKLDPDRLWNVAAALLAFFVAILCAVVLGEKVSEFLLKKWDTTFLGVSVAFGTGALALTVLVSTARDVIAITSNLPSYYKQLKSLPIFQDALRMFCAVMALVIAVRTLSPESAPKPAPLGLIAAVSLDDPEPVAVFPILFEMNGKQGLVQAAMLPANTEQPAATVVGWIEGADPAEVRVNEIVALLENCVGEARPYPVEIQVVGFASSKEFGSPETDDAIKASNDLNVDLANERTRKTVDAINARLTTVGLKEKIWVAAHENWRDYVDMVSARPVLDRFVKAQRTELENWTRRVDVRVLRAGTCTRRQILELTDVIRRAKPTPGVVAAKI